MSAPQCAQPNGVSKNPHSATEQQAFSAVTQVLKSWKNVTINDIEFTVYSGGITNKIVKAECSAVDGPQSVVVRLFGNHTEDFIDRPHELESLKKLAAAGCGPKLLGTFGNGLILEFVPGSSLNDGALLKEPHNIEMIAKELARWHTAPVTVDSEKPATFDECAFIRSTFKWIDTVPEQYSCSKKQALLNSSALSTTALRAEMKRLKACLSSPLLDVETAFCHNDLLAGNIVIDPTDEKAVFVDVEYGAYNFRCFDIANHWNEFTGLELDRRLFPSAAEQTLWCRAYLNFVSCDNDAKPTDSDVERLRQSVLFFCLASDLFWVAWALVQAHVSDIDFDYMSYSIARFDRYLRVRDAYMAPIVGNKES